MSQESTAAQQMPVHLQVEAGTPLRVYITRRVAYRVGEVVQAKSIEPVWAFDRVVIPAGTTLQGDVVKLDPVSKTVRARAIVGGDFTPLKRAEVSFTRLTLPDGHAVALQTEESLGLPTLYVPPRPSKKSKKQKTSSAKSSRAGQFLRQQVQGQLQNQANARSRGFYDFVRGPNKREWLENFVLSKLPYHPQWYRARTRFDTVLAQPLDFGTVEVASRELATSGSAPPSDSTAQMRLLSTISSADAHVGDPIEGVLSAPLFAQRHELVLPEGTRFSGRITLTQHARLFHRGGKLRFTIESVGASPSEVATDNTRSSKPANRPLQGQLVSVEADPKAVKVDSEGTATATESKTRLLRPAIAALVAAKSLDNDAGRQTASGTGTGTGSNVSGRSLGGFSGLGLLGTAVAYGPRPIGAALGFYGLAWSVYSNIIARGSEITFQKNTAIAIQFGNLQKK
ncbi:MAG TPA: hypothetical protein VGL97_21865 [Bryobacteraceae bacterium]